MTKSNDEKASLRSDDLPKAKKIRDVKEDKRAYRRAVKKQTSGNEPGIHVE